MHATTYRIKNIQMSKQTGLGSSLSSNRHNSSAKSSSTTEKTAVWNDYSRSKSLSEMNGATSEDAVKIFLISVITKFLQKIKIQLRSDVTKLANS